METPSIGDLKRKGAIGFIAICRRAGCGHRRRIPFSHVSLPDDAVFGGLTGGAYRICEKCGSPGVQLLPDWSEKFDV
jgi:hypothetical protein